MPFTTLNPADLEAGKPTKEEIFQTIKANEDYMNDAIAALQQTSIIDVFNVEIAGDISGYDSTSINDRMPVFKAPVGGTMVSFVITLLEPSTSGDIEVSLEKSIDNGINWAALLNNPVTVTGTTTGSISGLVDWIDISSQDFDQSDLLRLVIDGIQVDQGKFHIHIYAELS